MKLGISISNFSWPVPSRQLGSNIARVARLADEAGFESLWVMDHFFQIPLTGLPPESPMFEAYSTLGFLAASTQRIRLGTLVTAAPYRHPGVLIKTVTSLDVLSGGRINFGLGAGSPFTRHNVEEFEAGGLGIPFGSLATRFEELEEVLQIAHQMWRGDESPFDGKQYQLKRPLNSPNTLQTPHPPILIGGSGERRTLPLVARYADACNLFDIPERGFADDLRHKLDVLRGLCDEIGRDFDAIEKTTATAIDPDDLDELRRHLDELRDVGIDQPILSADRPWDEATLEALAGVLPALSA